MEFTSSISFGFLFDLDGVLIDSRDLHWQSWELLQKEVPAFQTSHEEFLRTFGRRNDEILQAKVPDASKDQIKEWGERKEEIFRSLVTHQQQQIKLPLLPGMEKFLATLNKAGIPRIIATSTPLSNLHFLMQATSLGTHFTQFVSAEEVQRGKPAPDIFAEAAGRLGLAPQACIVIEDSPAGLRAGRKAGCFVVALATTYSPDFLQAHESASFDLLYSSPRKLNLGQILQAYQDHGSPNR